MLFYNRFVIAATSSGNMRRNLHLLILMTLHFFTDAKHLLVKTKGAKRNSTRKPSGQDYYRPPPPRRPGGMIHRN